ncbi:hypothetical protein TNCT_631531 [Trichonephila clavata]|uniref:Uncharacterized protein n=1 Tax=Trichonephila clavata TaxID=2740835 RepID=A0A8X6FZZ9_TRICU|nr:hypothetical protein TNCT_631531 [Trichonephila clavata]
MCTDGVEKKYVFHAPPVTPEDKHELALWHWVQNAHQKISSVTFKNQLSSATVESNAFEMPIEQETDNNDTVIMRDK